MHRANPSNGRIFELDDCVTVHHQYNDVNNQQDAKNVSFINLFKSAQHVSGDKFAHSQEHFLIAYTDGFRNINKRKSCCILLFVYIVVIMMHGDTNINFINPKQA